MSLGTVEADNLGAACVERKQIGNTAFAEGGSTLTQFAARFAGIGAAVTACNGKWLVDTSI